MEWVVPNFLRQSENAHEVEEKTAHSIFIRHRLNNEFNLGAEEIRMIATQSDPNAKYFGDCRVVLSGDSMAAAPAFELACRKSFVTRWER